MQLSQKLKNVESERDSLLGKIVTIEKELKNEKQSKETLQEQLKVKLIFHGELYLQIFLTKYCLCTKDIMAKKD